jgi:Tol biopolymer transport system component
MNANAPEGRNNRPVKLTNNIVPDQMPDWSPNGKQIVFQRGPDSGPSEIFKMNSDGTHRRNLTEDPSTDLDPSFSPDGTRIAFDSNRDGDREIWKMHSDGSHPVNLTKNIDNADIIDANPSWQPIP